MAKNPRTNPAVLARLPCACMSSSDNHQRCSGRLYGICLTVNTRFGGYNGSVATTRQFQLVAGNLCLDFTNTLDNRGDREREEELLTDYGDLLAFLRQSSALAEPRARR